MDSENKMIVWIVGLVIVGIVTITIGLYAMTNWRTKIFVENGYTRTALPTYIQWTKEK